MLSTGIAGDNPTDNAGGVGRDDEQSGDSLC
ncbi:hypothetical protein BGP_6217 [Beggiatoa sp. PS]|nr:hypothetical protein BGP_6217 [Beggiatoa sp. PS]